MAAVHGKGGTVTFDTGDGEASLATITAWTYASASDTADVSGMGDLFTSAVPGLDTFTATADVVAQTTLDIPTVLGVSATLTLQIESGKTISAAAIAVSATETCSVDDVGRLSYSFVGNADTVTYPS